MATLAVTIRCDVVGALAALTRVNAALDSTGELAVRADWIARGILTPRAHVTPRRALRDELLAAGVLHPAR